MTKRIPLTQGLFATVDDADYEWLSQWKWYAKIRRGNAYAARRNPDAPPNEIRMHRQILELKRDQYGDHWNGDGLDNRRVNLRICSLSENQRNSRLRKDNTSGYKGVDFEKSTGKWRAQIRTSEGQRMVGRYDDVLSAAQAYRVAAQQYHGAFANLGTKEQTAEGKPGPEKP